MKKFFPVLLAFIVIFAMFAFPVTAFAQVETPPVETALDKVLAVATMFGSLAGVAGAIAALVNVGKAFRIVTDGNAGKWFAGLNLLALIGLIYIKLFQPQILIEAIDTQAAVLANIILIFLGYVVQLGFGSFVHGVLAKLRLPFIGLSFSNKH